MNDQNYLFVDVVAGAAVVVVGGGVDVGNSDDDHQNKLLVDHLNMVESIYVDEVAFEEDDDRNLVVKDNNIVDRKDIEDYFDRFHIDYYL